MRVMLFVQPASTRALQLTPSTNNQTIGRTPISDEPERRLALIPPLLSRFPSTTQRHFLGSHSKSSVCCRVHLVALHVQPNSHKRSDEAVPKHDRSQQSPAVSSSRRAGYSATLNIAAPPFSSISMDSCVSQLARCNGQHQVSQPRKQKPI